MPGTQACVKFQPQVPEDLPHSQAGLERLHDANFLPAYQMFAVSTSNMDFFGQELLPQQHIRQWSSEFRVGVQLQQAQYTKGDYEQVISILTAQCRGDLPIWSTQFTSTSCDFSSKDTRIFLSPNCAAVQRLVAFCPSDMSYIGYLWHGGASNVVLSVIDRQCTVLQHFSNVDTRIKLVLR